MADTKGSALILLAEGAEEMEAVIAADVLRRGNVKTVIGGLRGPGEVLCSRHVIIKPDMGIDTALKQGPYDAVILPGGLEGAENLAKSEKVKEILTEQYNRGGIVAAICAGPTVLAQHGIGTGKTATSYPTLKDKMTGYKYSEERVVKDDNLITSRGPGTAFEFGIELVRAVRGDDGEADKLASPMLLK
ncbi:protein/nucleic acid deglycase DJ-1-like [Actinia tenebrosa]|uniref:Protein/nucleic acid deglycase DJ-1-like n=1 Tax=Actinia tenebrosa TaxID=6105 RepID=A0A6P8J3W3_ACTTE|nr:protein/nucleic acid deglycase DJ-1-like [Actinia tenebrosa]